LEKNREEFVSQVAPIAAPAAEEKREDRETRMEVLLDEG
jgi:hypothetical protein